ncbi:MAG: hypothetical protein GY841_16240 [FCB group bacterium]|nr:hypothetical protein [FCB group bacterium]
MGPYYPNKDDWKEDFWGRKFKIWVGVEGFEFRVSADCLQSAFDEVIDYCVDHLPGLVLTLEEEDELLAEGEEFLDQHIQGGNEGRYLSTYNIHTEEV